MIDSRPCWYVAGGWEGQILSARHIVGAGQLLQNIGCDLARAEDMIMYDYYVV